MTESPIYLSIVPLLVVDTGAKQREVMVQQLGGLVLGQALGLRRELDDVGEHHRDLRGGATHPSSPSPISRNTRRRGT